MTWNSTFKQRKPMVRTQLRIKTSDAASVKVSRKCKQCKVAFEPARAAQIVCGAECGALLVEAKRLKAERAETKMRKEAIKTRSEWLKEAQAIFNQWIRERDAGEPCISCGRHHKGAHDAGHYRSVGAMPTLRFNKMNVHKQCVPCNQHKSGNIVEYRIRLLEKIGPEAVAFLEGHHDPVKLSIDEIKEIKTKYRAKLKQLKLDRGE